MHNKKPTASPTGSRTKTICAGILAAAALGGIFLGARYLDNRMNTTAIESDSYQAMYSEHNNSSYIRGSLNLYGEKYTYDHNFENYLFIGTDNSGTDEELKSPEETWQNGMADYLMLFTIDKTADTYAIIELNRDTMTTVHQILKDGTGESTGIQQLCTANWYGGTPELGSKNQIRAVSDLLGGLKINGYYSMDMDDISNINAAIGGVTVTLEEDFTHLDPQMKKGKTLKLTDQQAYYYLHNRMDVGDGTNEGRMARQHQYLTHFLEQEMKYSYIGELLKESEPGCHGTFFLPYLVGERYPVSDDKIKGAYIGITPNTTKQDLARACLEGVAYSLRSGFKSEIKAMSLIGGGAQEDVWCQIFADALDHETMVFNNAEFLPAISVASMAVIGSGKMTYEEFIGQIRESNDCKTFHPEAEAVAVMDEAYEVFKRIYPALKEV